MTDPASIAQQALGLVEAALLEQQGLQPSAAQPEAVLSWLQRHRAPLLAIAQALAAKPEASPAGLGRQFLAGGSLRPGHAVVGLLVRVVRHLARQEPQPLSAERDAELCPPENPACRLGLLGGACALPAPLLTPGSAGPVPQTARFCLAEATSLRASHDPLRGFAPTAGYPADVQERPYHRDKAEQLKVEQIAENLRPELIFSDAPGAIDGTPVVTPEGIVLGGNGRTMGLKLAYARGDGQAKEYLLQHAARFGFSPRQVAALQQPVLVRVIGGRRTPEALREAVRVLNVPLTQSLDVRAEAVAEARRLTEEVLQLFASAFDESASLAEFLRGSGAQELARLLRRAGILTDRNANRMLSGTRFSEEGERFVERLLAAAVLPSERLLSLLRTPEREGLARSAPFWIAAAGVAGPAWDVRPALAAAVEDLLDAQARGYDDLGAFLRQGALLPESGPLVLRHRPLGPLLLHILWNHHAAPLRLARIARAFAARARQEPEGQGSLLPAEALGPAQTLILAQQQVEAERR